MKNKVLEIRLCHGSSCRHGGSRAIQSAIECELGFVVGDADERRDIRLLSSPCLGHCGNTPVLQINGVPIPSPKDAECSSFIKKLLDKSDSTWIKEIASFGYDLPPDVYFDDDAEGATFLDYLLQCGCRLEDVLNTGGYETYLQKERISDILEFLYCDKDHVDGTIFSQRWLNTIQDIERSAPEEIIINAHTGVPGDHAERLFLEDAPHAVLEGALLVSEILQSKKITISIPTVFKDAIESIQAAFGHLRRHKKFKFKLKDIQLKVVIRESAFILAEESAAREALAGRDAMPDCENDSLDNSSFVTSVQSLLHLLFAAQNSYWLTSWAISLNAGFRHPGVYEFSGSQTLLEIVEKCGLEQKSAVAVLYGGPMGRLYLRDEWSRTMSDISASQPDQANQSMLLIHGSRDENIFEKLSRDVLEFCAVESCGKCVPCRVGSFRLLQIKGILDQEKNMPEIQRNRYAEEISNIQEALESASLCRLGQATGERVRKLKSGSIHPRPS